MDPQRWESIQRLFHAVADLPPDEQTEALARACPAEPELREEVVALLRADAEDAPVMNGSLPFLASQLFDEQEDLYLGRTFGPYELKKLIGTGGMGRVYLAERHDYGGIVAIKVLHDALSPERRDRFAGEERLLAQLTHPAIARLYDAGTLPDGTPFFAMEYVTGLPLVTYAQQKQLSITARLQLFREICEAVQHLHQNLVIHRDLKPSNILVREDGKVKLLDFGVAESLAAGEDEPNRRPKYMTLAYAAPEQVRGERAAIQADIYALGVILQELLTGELPFDFSEKTIEAIKQTLLTQVPRKPSEVIKRLALPALSEPHATEADWKDLDAICCLCLKKDPAQRYKTADALAREIDAFLCRYPLAARRPHSPAYRATKFMRRNARAVAVASAATAFLAGIILFYTVRLTKARNAAVAEAARAEAVEQFITNLFTGGDSGAGPEKDLSVLSVLDRGEKEARALHGKPAFQAELFETLGGVYEMLGQFNRSRPLLMDALKQRQAIYGTEHPQVAETMMQLSQLDNDVEHNENAEKWAREALRITLNLLPADDLHSAEAQFWLAEALVKRGKHREALRLYNDSLTTRLARKAPLRDIALNYSGLGMTYFYLGDYSKASEFMERGLAIDRQLHGAIHPDVAADYLTMASVAEMAMHYAQAEDYERKALAIEQKWFRGDHPEVASAMTAFAQTLALDGQARDALTILQQALAMEERAYSGPHNRIARTLSSLGHAEQHLGDYAKAEDYFSRSLAMYRTISNGKDYRIGTEQANLGDLALEQKNYPRAETYYQQAISTYRATLPATSQFICMTEGKLGHLLEIEQRYDEAEHWLLASYELFLKQSDPPLASVNKVRNLLVKVYEACHDPEKAEPYRSAFTEADLKRALSAAAKKSG